MCIESILELENVPLLLVLLLVVLFPSLLLNPKGYGFKPSASFTHCNQHCN